MLLIAWIIFYISQVVPNCAEILPSSQIDIINLNLLLVRIKLSDDDSVDQYASEETLSQYAWGEEDSVLTIFAQSSYGALNIPADLGDIQTVTLSTTKTDYASDIGGCDFSLLGDHAVLSLEDAGYSTSSYDLISFYMPLSIPCEFAGGTSYIGEPRSWMRREGVAELAHQLGRSLGLHDASTSTDNDDLVDEGCELCDNSCVMGDPSGAVTMNAVNRKRLGWIQSESAAYRDFSYCSVSSACQTFVRIADLQQAPDVSVAQGAFTLIQLPRLNRQGTAILDSYYVSYRGGSVGQDTNLESRYRNTVSLHHWSESNTSDSNTKLIASMRVEETFIDLVSYKGGLMTASIIHVESIADGLATVQVFVNNVLNLNKCVDVTVVMRDSYGDGWQGNVLFIGNQVVSLADSSSGQVTVCLPYGEYYPHACGGRDPEEVSWDILEGDRELVSNGEACSSSFYRFILIEKSTNPDSYKNVVSDPTTLMWVQNIWLEGGYALVGGQDWVKVSSSVSTFTVASVFMSLPTVPGRYANESFPAIARVRDVKVSGGRVTFETRLYQANDSFCSKQWHVPQPIAAMLLPWLIVQHGAYSVAGHYFMVGSANITKTDNSLSDYNYPRINYYVGCYFNATALCSYPAGSKVGIILQLQTVVNDRLLIPRCKVVALRFFRAGLQNHDSSDTSYYSISSPELLSYMSFPTGIKFYCHEKFVFETTFGTLSSVKQTFNFLKREGDYFLPALYGTVTTATGNNLVAIRPVDQALDSVSLLLQEDQCTKEETVHGSEEVALLSLVNAYNSYSDKQCMAVFNSGTFSPTSSPTLRPTLAPTAVPTAFPSYVRCKIYKTPVNVFVQNKRIGVSINSLTPCECDAAHVVVDMRDTYGDGWNDHKMYLGTEIITPSKMISSQWVGCLSPGSYAPYVCGGKRLAEEISWSIFVNGVKVLSDGRADYTCKPISGFFNVTLSPCVYGYTHVVVLMRDAAGDGWCGNRMFIGNETLTLAGGSSGEQGVCLPPGLYAPYVCEGVNDSDIEWDIVVGGKKVIVGGKADDSCSPSSGSFSVGCVSVTIYMRDSEGNGWSGNMLHIGSESFTLSDRFSGKETVCLPVGTYSPYVCGGYADREITWSIIVKGVEIISNGKADDTCLPSSGSFKVYSNTLHMEVMTEAPTLSPTTSPTVVVPSKTVITLPPTREPLPPTNVPTASVISLSKQSAVFFDQTFTLVLMISSALFCLMGFGFYILARRYMPNEEFKNWLDFNRWLDASKRCDDQQLYEDSEYLYKETPTQIFYQKNPQFVNENIEMRLKKANRLPQHRRSAQMISELKSLADLSDNSDSTYEKVDSIDLAW